MKYPVGIQSFEKIRKEGFAYVDKTALIYKLADEGSYYFLSRPRRFGKSLLISTMEAYFSGRKDLFEGLAIEKLEKKWTAYPIMHLDLNAAKYDSEESLYHMLNDFLSHFEDVYGSYRSEVTLELRFKGIIERMAKKTGLPVVILVDEYDKPMLQAITNKELQEKFRSTLKAFYSVLKTQDRYIRFAFFTGVTKFGKVSVFSDLNYLTDLSMDERYDTICGISKEELIEYFQEGIQSLAKRYSMSYEDTVAKLKKRYDGYHFVEDGHDIYNPFSLLSTFVKEKFGSYWFETGTPSFLVELLKRDDFYLPDLTEQQVSGDFLNSIDSIEQSPVPIIYQSGYLTIKSYDKRFGFYTLGYPNEEVEEGWANYLLPFYSHVEGGGGPMFIGRFVSELEQGRPEAFMQRMESLFAGTDYKIVGDAEKYFQNAFYLVTLLLGFYVDVERSLSNGRIDMVAKTKDYIYIFEFKYDKSPEEALRQIDEKGYAKPYASDPRQLIKIGVNFSREKRCIEGWKVVRS
jgi:hypothetical protein